MAIQTIEKLDVSSLAVGEYEFMFNALTTGLNTSHQLPVKAFKGSEEGRRMMITAGLHGDELNGVLTAHEIIRWLQANKEHIIGTIIVVPVLNPTGVLAQVRDFIPSDTDASPSNLNRFFPGDQQGDAAKRYVHNLWNNLLQPNADLAIDLHTQTRGALYPLYVFADYRIRICVDMAKAMNPDVILDDPGDDGVLETCYNRHNIPSITVEVGTGVVTEPNYIQRAVEGIKNVLIEQKIINASYTIPCEWPVEGKTLCSIRAEVGGFAISQVNIGETVKEGQLVSLQYDQFGQEIHRYLAPTSGYVLSVNSTALREPGALLVRLIY